MEFKLNITIGFTEETLQAVTSLAAAIRGGLTVSNSLPSSNGSANGASKVAAKKTMAAVEEMAKGSAVTQPTAAAITLEELRKATVDKANKSTELKAKVKEILSGYAVKSVSNLPEEKYQEFFTKISEL